MTVDSSNTLLLSNQTLSMEVNDDNGKEVKNTFITSTAATGGPSSGTAVESATITGHTNAFIVSETTTIMKKREKFCKDSNGERIRDEKGYRLRAAGLCSRIGENFKTELLLVSGRGNTDQWCIPGGGIEENENAEEAAKREVHEEAGIKGSIQSLVGEFQDDERLNRTFLYVLNVVEECDVEDWEDGRHGRQRCWMSISEALAKIKNSQRVMLESYIDGELPRLTI